MAMHAHLQQKMDHIAVMKSLGATSTEIIRIYTLQTLMLGVVGGLAGVAVGRARGAGVSAADPEIFLAARAAWAGISRPRRRESESAC